LHLLHQVQETRKLQRALKATMAKNEAILDQLKNLTTIDGPNGPGPLAFLLHGGAASKLGISANIVDANSGPLTTNVSFALSQLPALQELLAQLRPNVPSLDQSANAPATEGALAKERRIYVESQSRRAMERQGLAPGIDASETLGRIVTTEELASLENMVQDVDD
jgi:kinetochore protein Mis12/MTW1